ncbi:glycosyltransferase-like protein [Halorhabdus tiamatea SARL4B]|uniref:Glycosyltransferase-like protein n=1 Tax=Halorhabdus tiamatea SARL4B TaxID=1033806 RepID=F7PQC4_9EURY|nr:glycosyl transferase family 2 [Halorhabdus tiamatea]ERJ06119.1 glycosyltransferase-like protein [Halorhabdus tiamatea SARL4B]CCQ33253.1 glycosyltransferase-like protein [Halorhabdus tiamatea SARL4B]
MEYVQERIATLHDFDGVAPSAPTDRAVVVVPMTARDHASLAAERVFSTLETVAPREVIVALRADPDRVDEVTTWLGSFDLSLEILWCSAPAVESALADARLDGQRGKGRDVWLALGVAAGRGEYVAVHDADAGNYAATHVPRLLFPLSRGYEFSKGYYARVENDRLYGRLFRLLYVPVVRALADAHDAAILAYLGAFRYALAGEFAATSDLVRRLRVPRGWGLEVGTLAEAYGEAGFEDTAQVDLGMHEHDHRAVGGPDGLGTMASEVAASLFRALEGAGVMPDYDSLPGRYRERARSHIERYATDAAFNGLTYDRADERAQVDAYAAAIEPPGVDDRLPAWEATALDPERIATLASEALAERRG